MARIALAASLVLVGAAASASELVPAMVWTGPAPAGACKGYRVAFEAATGKTWCWTLAAAPRVTR